MTQQLFTYLKNFQNLTPQNISLILESCGTDRIKLYNELNKVILYFVNKRIEKKNNNIPL